MHNAPRVSYPVGRSWFGAAVLLLVWFAAVVLSGLWFWQTAAWGWRQAIEVLALLASGALALAGWQRAPSGVLRWSGSDWEWTADGGHAQAQQAAVLADGVHVCLDLQSRMLLLVRGGGRSNWLWLERGSQPSQWLALRRAVYATPRRAKTIVDLEPSA